MRLTTRRYALFTILLCRFSVSIASSPKIDSGMDKPKIKACCQAMIKFKYIRAGLFHKARYRGRMEEHRWAGVGPPGIYGHSRTAPGGVARNRGYKVKCITAPDPRLKSIKISRTPVKIKENKAFLRKDKRNLN